MMASKYDKCIAQWDEIFSEQGVNAPTSQSLGNETLDDGIMWVCQETESILDFGCGHGTMLLVCALNGTKHHIGIDLSKQAIVKARERAKQMPVGEFNFIQGSIEAFEKIEDSSLDAVILSNILDNLYPDDSEALLCEVRRVLKSNGKVLLKLNSYVTPEQIAEWELEVIKDDLLDDGLLLLNRTTEVWTQIFEKDFDIVKYTDVHFPDYEQTNRMFYLTKK